MALLWKDDLPGSRTKRRAAKGGGRQLRTTFLLIFVLTGLLYWYLLPLLSWRSAGSAPSRFRFNVGGNVGQDSSLRLDHVTPSSWTSNDVGHWLESIDLGVLKTTFKKNGVNGAVLLELSQRSLMRDLLIENEVHISRIMQEIKVLKHRVHTAHRWGPNGKGETAPARAVGSHDVPLKEIKLYKVGDSIFHDKDETFVAEGVTPAATLHKTDFFKLQDLISLASEELGRKVREFVAHNGDMITSMEELPTHVYALCENDFYVLPTERLGFKNAITLEAEDKQATVETLSLAPRVYRVDQFLAMDEAKNIMKLAENKMEPSTIAEEGDQARDGVNKARTSSTAWLTKDADALIGTIRQRVADLIKVPVYLAEDMQVLHYAPGQYYHAHHDFFDPKIYRGFVVEPGQNRFITVFFYLTDVEEGGETNFPFSGDESVVTDFTDCSRGLKVKPKAGDAIIFYSLLPQNQQEACPKSNPGCNLDVRSLHAGCPVIRGDKWAANYWVSNK